MQGTKITIVLKFSPLTICSISIGMLFQWHVVYKKKCTDNFLVLTFERKILLLSIELQDLTVGIELGNYR